MPVLGTRMTEAHKRAISDAHKGKTLSKRHKKSISKAMAGHEVTEQTREKIRKQKLGEKNPIWNNRVSHYRTVHLFLAKYYGRASYCQNKECPGESDWFDWAKKENAEYTRNPDDYMQLCRQCHNRYDTGKICVKL